jgi:xanthine/CO dehydrogenase XdhC/CoxF family maturation factor
LARLGRLQEARSEVQAGLGINPSFTIARFCAGAFTDYPNVVADGNASLTACARPACRRHNCITPGPGISLLPNATSIVAIRNGR